MKKIFTLFLMAFAAMTVSAQEPLYTINTKLAADPEWGDEYAADFAFQGTEVTVEVYADDYVIIKNWAGAQGCDLKVEYDSSIDVNDDNCNGNIIALTSIINGVEQEPLNTYSKEIDGYTYNYIDIKTGREDYPVCSTTLNEDGTFYWSFVELDNENQSGYVELSAYFMTADYDTENLGGYYYYCAWPEEAGETFYGTFEGTIYDEYDETATSFPPVEGKITVDAYSDHIVVHSLAGVEGFDMTVTFDADDNVTSITPPTKTGAAGTTVTSGWCSIYTGLESDNWKRFQAYMVADYCYAGADEKSGYILLYGYDATGTTYAYYYLYWGEDDDTAINSATTAAGKTATGTYNLAGQRVNNTFKGIVIKNGRKVVK